MKRMNPLCDIRCVTVLIAAELLGISCGLCYSLVHAGQIPSVRLGRRILIPLSALNDMLSGNGKGVSTCHEGNAKPPMETAPSTIAKTGGGGHPSG